MSNPTSEQEKWQEELDRSLWFIEDTSSEYEEVEICECGQKKKLFMHNCNGTSNLEEMNGCPDCDDHCGFCK